MVELDRYKSTAVTVPPYLTYVSVRRNILAENDRSLKYYPYFGEEGPDRKSGLEKELEERFKNRIKHLPLRHWYAEQAQKIKPYAERFLDDVGCRVIDVLYLFLDRSRLKEPGEAAAPSLRKWHAKCFATDSGQAHKKWQKLFVSLEPPKEKALDRAELACRAFYEVTKLSLWYIIRNHEVAVEHMARAQRRRELPMSTQELGPYTELGCLLCHV